MENLSANSNQQPPRRSKTVSERQLRANQANAQKSTGPRTEEGKAISKYNSLQYGLTCFMVCLPGEDKQLYEEMRASIHDTFRPANVAIRGMCDNLMSLQWRILRIARFENCIIREKMLQLRTHHQEAYDQLGVDVEAALSFKALCDDSRVLDRLDRYEGRLQRQHARLLKQLTDLCKNPPSVGDPDTAIENCQNEPIPINEHLCAPDPEPIGNAATPHTIVLKPRPVPEICQNEPIPTNQHPTAATPAPLATRHSPLVTDPEICQNEPIPTNEHPSEPPVRVMCASAASPAPLATRHSPLVTADADTHSPLATRNSSLVRP